MSDHDSELDLRRAIAGDRHVSANVRALLRSPCLQDAWTDPDTDQALILRVMTGDRSAALSLYARYTQVIDRASRRVTRGGVFDGDDAHQEGALVVLEMAMAGAADFQRRIEKSILHRVSDAALRHSKTLSGFSRDQIRTVSRALRDADENVAAAKEMVTTHDDDNRRMRADTFDAIIAMFAPAYSVDEARDKPASGGGHPGADENTATWLSHLVSTLDSDSRSILIKAYGLFGFAAAGTSDAELALVLGCSRRQANKQRLRALSALRDAARRDAGCATYYDNDVSA